MDVPLAWRGGAPIGRETFLREVCELAERLPERGHVINYCDDRYYFLVALGAAMVRGQVTHLPHDRTPHSLVQLVGRHDGAYCLTDGAGGTDGVDSLNVGEMRLDGAAHWSPPTIPASRIVAEVYTGGTTGEPRGNVKSWGNLFDGSWRITKATGLDGFRGATIVATVPPQHMYGLEFSVVLPLAEPFAVHAGRPFYPADVEQAVAEVPGPVFLISTPVHLKVLAAARPRLPGLAGIISATAPVTPELVREVEDALNVPFIEVFGCSEAGSLGARRPGTTERWRTLDGITLRHDGERCYADISYMPEPVALHDRITLHSPVEFELRGRLAEMVNVAGKRASLSGLNAILTSIPGVLDGAFFVPDMADDGGVPRLTAYVVAPALTARGIRKHLRERIDPAFLPRPLHLVDRLPRSETGKLTKAALSNLAAETRHGRR